MVYILLGTGFEEIEAITPYDLLKRAGVEVSFAGVGGREVKGSHGIVVKAECTAEDIDVDNAEMIVVPGGFGGVASISGSEAAMNAVLSAFEAGKEIASICAGPTVLAKLGILEGRRATCYPGLENELTGARPTQETPVVRDGKITTSRGAGTATDFGLALISVLKGEDASETVRTAIHYEKR